MTCPFCGAALSQPTPTTFCCPGGGPRLTDESGPCRFAGDLLTSVDLDRITTSVTDGIPVND